MKAPGAIENARSLNFLICFTPQEGRPYLCTLKDADPKKEVTSIIRKKFPVCAVLFLTLQIRLS